VTGVAEGLRVLDFTWFAVGPVTTKYLADYGADVVRIESAARPDGLRGSCCRVFRRRIGA